MSELLRRLTDEERHDLLEYMIGAGVLDITLAEAEHGHSRIEPFLAVAERVYELARAKLPKRRVVPEPLPEYDSAWHAVWLHGDWSDLTTRMTTEERNAAASAVERHWDRHGLQEPGAVSRARLRWWDR